MVKKKKKKKMQLRNNSEEKKFNGSSRGSFGSILQRRYRRLIGQGRGAPKAIPFHQKIGEFRVQDYYADVEGEEVLESSPVKEHQTEAIILFHDSDIKMQDTAKNENCRYEILKVGHKKIESWSFRKGGNFDHQKIKEHFLDDAHESILSSSLDKSEVVHFHGWKNHLMSGFKQRIKRALQKKSGSRTTEFDLRAITRVGPPEVDFNLPMRRSGSVDETVSKSAMLEKYARLLETVCFTDTTKQLHRSRSLKLKDEDDREAWRVQLAAEFRRKAASLSQLESSAFLLGDRDVSNDEDEVVDPPSEVQVANEASNFQIRQGHDEQKKEEDLQNMFRSYYRLDKTVEANFNFVRDLLELSGFNQDETLSSTKDLEALESLEQKLLFDLVNDVLGEIRDTKFTSFDRWNRPRPKGEHVLEDVWNRVCLYTDLSSEKGLSYTQIVARDVSKEDRGWVKIGAETECVAIEVEDLIFDDLLDEALCCFEGAFDYYYYII